MASWMLVGFVHGVMNTDNMTISGETIDYGPCAFMEAYDPETVFSSIDSWGRYAYDNQPTMAGWNLARFAETLLPLFSADEHEAISLAERSFDVFRAQYEATWSSGMRAKLGLSPGVDAQVVAPLIGDLLLLLHANHVDYTSFFRRLSQAGRWRRRNVPERSRILDSALARAGSGSGNDGPDQPDLYSAQSSRRGGTDRRDGG